MIERQKRLNEVYQYLRQHRGIHTKSDFAESIHYGRTSMSAALNGNESYLTDSLFKKICYAFPDTFSLQYLLTGEGQLTHNIETDLGTSSTTMLVADEETSTLHEEPATTYQPIPRWADNLIDILTKQIKENEALHRELRQSITEVNTLRDDLQKLIKKITQKS